MARPMLPPSLPCSVLFHLKPAVYLIRVLHAYNIEILFTFKALPIWHAVMCQHDSNATLRCLVP